MAAMAADAAGMMRRLAMIVEARAAQRRRDVAAAAEQAGVEDVEIAGETVRLNGRGLTQRWMSDLSLREVGRGRG